RILFGGENRPDRGVVGTGQRAWNIFPRTLSRPASDRPDRRSPRTPGKGVGSNSQREVKSGQPHSGYRTFGWSRGMSLRTMALAVGVRGVVMPVFLMPMPTHAVTATSADCDEAAEFIANAARSRDNGLTAEAFFARFDGDLELLQALPPDLRWFVRDADDEAL